MQPSKPDNITALEKTLSSFGFVPVYFEWQTEARRTIIRNKSVAVYEDLEKVVSGYKPGWRFIETIYPTQTYRRIVNKEPVTLVRDPQQLSRFLIDPYQNEPFADILDCDRSGINTCVFTSARTSRGMYLPQRILSEIIPAIAAKIGVEGITIRLPYMNEYFQCLQENGVLEWWPDYYVSEWLQDHIPEQKFSGTTRDGKFITYPYNFYLIIHSLLHRQRGIQIDTSLRSNFDTTSDRYNPSRGFRLVIEPTTLKEK